MTKHSAPAVIYPIGRSRSQFWFFWLLWLAGLVLLLLWFAITRRFDWRIGLGCASVLASGWALRHGWYGATSGQLAWDGSCWRWEGMQGQIFNSEETLSVAVDFQRIMVVVLNNGSRRRRLWFCAERSAFPERWLDFRRAVYAAPKILHAPAAIDHMAG